MRGHVHNRYEMKRNRTKENAATPARFTTLSVLPETKDEFREFSDERARDTYRVAAASIKALKRLTREEQDALIEGRPLEPAQS